MESLAVLNIKGEKVSTIKLNELVWGIVPNDSVLYDAIRLTQNSLRQGTASTKTRSEVSGGGRKPYRQKGTGRARQGSIRAPHYPGGGIVFGPHPRSYSIKMNKKERRLALKSALSYKVIESELVIVDKFDANTNKTKDMVSILENLKLNKKTLIVVDEITENLILSTRNLKNIILIAANEINVLDVVSADNMLITKDAVKMVEEALI